MEIEKGNVGNLILKYDVIHDALKLIYNENLKRLDNFDDRGTGRNLSKNSEIA